MLDRSVLFVIVMLLFGFMGAVLWLYVLVVRPRRQMTRLHAVRLRRLSRIASDPRGAERFPHRMIELKMLRRLISRRLARKCVMPPGTVVVANGARLDQWPRPVPNDVAFEPIEVPTDENQLKDLIDLNVEQQISGAQVNWPGGGNSNGASAWEETKQKLRRAAAYWGLMAWPLIAVLNIWRTGFSVQGAYWMAIGTIFVLSIVAAVLYERKWFLIPGAMVHRVSPFYRWHSKTAVYRSEECGLLIDARTGQGFVVCDGEAHLFYCADFAYWPVVAGWISTARRPSRGELDELIGK